MPVLRIILTAFVFFFALPIAAIDLTVSASAKGSLWGRLLAMSSEMNQELVIWTPTSVML
jgi:hypothetical protein